MPALATDRRDFLRSTAALSAGLVLPGCATLATRATPTLACTPLPRVRVEPGRVIRTVAGLRPYRASGFVVRAEALGDQRLVHNYGHGGAGITLSWGCSKLATDIGLPGHRGRVAVIGAGVMGLTTAKLVQEAGFPVTIYAKALPPATTSNIAGGQISPFGHFRDDMVTPEWRRQFMAAMDYSWRRFQIMVGEDYGIRWLPTFEETDTIGPGPLDGYRPNTRRVPIKDHPFPIDNIAAFETMYVETGRFLRQTMRDIQTAGGKIAVRDFRTPQEFAALPEQLLFNCTGLGSRDLFGTASFGRFAGSSPCCCPSPRCNTPSVAMAFTCSRAPTASFSAARSNATYGRRCPSRRRSRASSPGIRRCSTDFAALLDPPVTGSI